MCKNASRFVAALVLIGAGCAQRGGPALKQPTAAEGGPAQPHSDMPIFGSTESQPPVSHDPRPALQFLVRLNVYQITVPSRAVSRSEAFWKHVEEGPAVLDPATHDLLDKNGIRVGIAKQADWDYFRGILMKQRAVTQMSTAKSDRPTVMEVSLKPRQDSENLFWYTGDGEGALSGQLFDRVEDRFAIRFLPTPRGDGDVTVSVTPLLRSWRERIDYTMREEEVTPHLQGYYPEYLFDLRLRAVIPYASFMVIGPSLNAHAMPILGRNFLLQDGQGEQFETVLLLSPQAFRLDDPTTQSTTEPTTKP